MQKTIVILRGPTAGGKSSIARELRVAHGLPIVEVDEVKDELSKTIHSADYSVIRSWFREAGRRTEQALKNGEYAVAVEAFRDSDLLGAFLAGVGDTEVETLVVVVLFPLEEHIRRHGLKDRPVHKSVGEVKRYYQEYLECDKRLPVDNDLVISDVSCTAKEASSRIWQALLQQGRSR